jgi:hypothetical protein
MGEGTGAAPTAQRNQRPRPFEPRTAFNSEIFSERELGLMYELAEEYRNHRADEMVEATHIPGQPWHELYEVRGLRDVTIPYDFNLPEEDREVIEELASDHSDVVRNFAE